MRVVFMGTPEFAVPTLEALHASRHEVACAVTQPDRPKGRGKALAFPPVKERALAYGISVLQPVKARDPEFVGALRAMSPDAIVVAAYGQILPQEILDIPPYGCLNVHASLLPKLRGAAPIPWAILTGERTTGVTIMQMDAGLDTGDILLQEEIPLEEKETAATLGAKLSRIGGPLALKALSLAEEGALSPRKQGEPVGGYAKMLTKPMGRIDFSRSAEEIERLVRGLNPWPSAYAFLDGKSLKIWEADALSQDFAGTGAAPGEVVAAKGDSLVVRTGAGDLAIRKLQMEGKRAMGAGDFLRGYPVAPGTMLG